MNQQDRIQVADILKGEVAPLMEKLNAIHEQTMKTNGRVNRLENETIPFVHKRISEAKDLARTESKKVDAKLSILSTELTLIKWLTSKPIRLIGVVVIAVLLIENREALNIVKFLK